MVMVNVGAERIQALQKHLEGKGIKILPRPQLRLVTHLDVDAQGIDRTIEAFRTL
jgi:threonine aldolase